MYGLDQNLSSEHRRNENYSPNLSIEKMHAIITCRYKLDTASQIGASTHASSAG